MKFLCYVERLNRMNRLMQRRSTGTPSEFATLVGVSRTRLYEIIDELKSYGAPIIYDKDANTFQYEYPFDISITFSAKQLNAKDEKKYFGGAIFSHEYFFSGRDAFNFTPRKLTSC
jgi:transcriptional antiterminator